VAKQWAEIAREQKMPEAVIEDVGALLETTLSANGLTAAAVAHPNIRDSLRRFIPEFRQAFTSQKNSSDFSHYFVWLVAEAIQRGPSDRAALEAARADFRRCTEMYGVRVQADFRAQLGEDFAEKYQTQIREGIEWTRDTATRQFEMFQVDPLFPSFKGPLNNEAIQAAIEHASSAEDYESEFKRPLRMMIAEEVGYVERLNNFFNYRPRELLYGYVSADLQNRLSLNRYWGPVEHTTISTPPGRLWPVEVWLHVNDKGQTTSRGERSSSGAHN
jgi:hypothetical protein